MAHRFETVAAYPTAVAAELAAAALRHEGIAARLRDEQATSVMPHLAAALGNVKIDVPAEDAERARQLLRDIEAIDTDGLSDDPRCPRCESTFLKEVRGKLRCHRCDHRFEHEDAIDPVHGAGAGPGLFRGRAPPPSAGNDVFLLRRDSKGMGLFLGASAGFGIAAAGVVGAVAPLAPLAMAWLGWLVGRARVYYVCSAPGCRTPLRSTMERCPGCNGRVRGDVDRPGDHWVERARLRREDDDDGKAELQMDDA